MIKFDPSLGLREYINDELKRTNHSYDEKISLEENLIKVFALKRRVPETKPRIVIELPGIKVPLEHKKDFILIKKKIANGTSIKGHLSTGILKYSYNDSLLNSWGINHLHLSTSPGKHGFFKRTGPILFVMFFKDVAILIDILEHGVGHSNVWVNNLLIEKLHQFLPEAISFFRSKNVTGAMYTPEEMTKLRRSNVNYAMKLNDGSVYNFIGTMSNGDHFFDVHSVMHIQNHNDYFKNVIETSSKQIYDSMKIRDDIDIALTTIITEGNIKLYAPQYKTIININNINEK